MAGERKPNAEKQKIMQILHDTCDNMQGVTNLQLTNKERQLKFELAGEEYEVTLIQKRKAK